jgi:hypothetical protein
MTRRAWAMESNNMHDDKHDKNRKFQYYFLVLATATVRFLIVFLKLFYIKATVHKLSNIL